MSNMYRRWILFLMILVLAGCSRQAMYHWHKPQTGMPQFVEDHNSCLCTANFFPWTSPQWLHPTEQYNTRLKSRGANGIWASYIPYQGAQPIYVNSQMNDSAMLRPLYATCMEKSRAKADKAVVLNKEGIAVPRK